MRRTVLLPSACTLLAGSTTAVLALGGAPASAVGVALQVGGTSLAGSTVPLRAEVLLPDASAVAVSWVLDGVYAGRDTTGPFAFALSTSSGEHKLKARATSAAGVDTTYEVRFTAAAGQLPSATASPTPTISATSGPSPIPSIKVSPTATTSRTATTSPTATPSPTTSPAPGTVRNVRTASELTAALSAATPGTVIALADGTYRGYFTATRSGTALAPVVLRGSRTAVLDGGDTSSGYALHLDGAQYWRLEGFSVRGAQKGVVLDRSSHAVLSRLDVGGSGMEGVHFRTASSDNRLEDSLVHDTGRDDAGFGEGVYLGSATSNWSKYGGGGPDRSDRNTVIGNRIWATTAENLDIKEGTTGGLVTGNSFDGGGITGAHFGDSWIDVKGNGYAVLGNRGVRAPQDGFQTHVQLSGWGRNNTFGGNTLDVGGPGYGISVDEASSSGNVVRCDNTILNAKKGLSNQPCK